MPSHDRSVRIRSAVRRLLNGERNQHDLTLLCLWLRYPRTSKGSVPSEIGNLVAHSDERDQGLAFQAVEDFYWMWDGVQRYNYTHPNDKRTTEISYKKQLDAIIRRLSATDLRERHGVNIEYIRQKLEECRKKAIFDEAVGVYFDPPLDDKINAIHDDAMTGIVASPAFTMDQLAEEYYNFMLQHGLIKTDERDAWNAVIPFFAAYIICSIHLTKIKINDDVEAFFSLAIGMKDSGGKLQVWADFIIPNCPGQKVQVFDPEILASDWCEPFLMSLSTRMLNTDNKPWVAQSNLIPAIELNAQGDKIIASETDVEHLLKKRAQKLQL